MRTLRCLFLLLGLGIMAGGCGPRKPFNGPTVDSFTGKLTHDGKPITIPAEDKVQLKLFHEKGESFGIPIQSDGSFKIGWMPLGKYSATLIRERAGTGAKKGPQTATIPSGLTVEQGKTEYTIELGKAWKP